MLPRNKREKKRVGRMRVKEDKVLSASVIAWRYTVLTLLDYVGQREANTVMLKLPGKFVLL
jgi:hypothetical protein